MCVQPQDAAATFRLKYKCINNLEYSLNRLVYLPIWSSMQILQLWKWIGCQNHNHLLLLNHFSKRKSSVLEKIAHYIFQTLYFANYTYILHYYKTEKWCCNTKDTYYGSKIWQWLCDKVEEKGFWKENLSSFEGLWLYLSLYI